MRSILRIITTAIVAVTLAGVTATQAQNTWTGAIDDSYNTANNWSAMSVPDGDSTTNPYVVIANPAVNGTINYYDGETNSVRSMEWYGGMTLNQFGGYLNSTRSGNNVRDWVGKSATSATFNLKGGTYQSSHMLRVGIGGEGIVNLDGGNLLITRAGNGSFGNGTTVSLSIGQTTAGTINITDGTLLTRVGVELGDTATFNVHGAGSTIDIGGGDLDGDWFQNSNAVLRVGISTNGVSPIVIGDAGQAGTPLVKFKPGAVLDVGFIDGAMETNFWPIMVNANGLWSNLGMVPAAGVDTNEWGWIISNNVMYVAYGLGWPFGDEVLGPPPSQRTLYWTGDGGDTDVANPTNWVLDLAATQTTDWGPYDNDIWRIADANVVGVGPGTNYVVDYEDGDAVNTSHRDLEVGISTGTVGAQGTFNMNSGTLKFTTHSGGRQEFGLNTGGDGTVNMNDGILHLNAARFGVAGGTGALNVNGGTLQISRGYRNFALWVGHDGASTGTVTVTGGRMFTRSGVKLGDGVSAIGIFSVEGSAATDIGIGSYGSLDGEWTQNAGSLLKVGIDSGGLTPIYIDDPETNGPSGAAPATFEAGALLEPYFISGVTTGTWTVMIVDGSITNNGLAFAPSVTDANWSFSIVSNQLQVTYKLDVTITAPASGYLTPVNEAVEFLGSFAECGSPEACTAEWIISNAGMPDTTFTGTLFSVTNVMDEFIFPDAGIYSITLAVTDGDGITGQSSTVYDPATSNDLPAYIVVYDPDGGFVTGGGWIWSPVGAFHPELEEFAPVEGRANFGFVAKYKKGAHFPTGQTEFQFKAGGLNFHSSSYQWLVVAGKRAMFKGVGSINGADGYGFMLTGIDGDIKGGDGKDRFRIKIWYTDEDDVETMIYDNQAGSNDDAELGDATILRGGNIVIHKR